MGEFVTLEVAAGIATVTMARPERLNALHPAAHYELAAMFDGLAVDKSVRVVIVTGAGKAFCAGYDLKHNLETGIMDIPPSGFAGFTFRADYPRPDIAAVKGPAFGGGFELALACDLIIAAEAARFALPEPKVGWVALGGGIQRLPAAIGMKQAMGMILTGRQVAAEEGLRLGFVNEVVPQADLLAAARRWAAQIIECAPLAIACSREVVRAMHQPAHEVLFDMERYPVVAALFASGDAAEGKRAFAARRRPVWTGE
jgi:enoyl-CoA hydratase/carnithine racemase